VRLSSTIKVLLLATMLELSGNPVAFAKSFFYSNWYVRPGRAV